MNTRIAFPFLVLSEDAISVDQWLIGDPDEPLGPAESILHDWDYARDLEVAMSMSVDWDQVSEELALPASDVRLGIALIAGTGSGSIPRRQERLAYTVVTAPQDEFEIRARVPGRSLSGRLQLRIQVTMAESPVNASPLSPATKGARLYTDYFDILLEDGGASRFPIESASFRVLFKGKSYENAPWFLHWRPSGLQADFSSVARLYVNSDHEQLMARFQDADSVTLQAIMGDVISQMLESALDEEDIAVTLQQCEEGSVGQQIANWLAICFPNRDVSSVRRLRTQAPGEFRSAILAAAEMGGV